MSINNILEFPVEILHKIWSFCSKKSLINFSSCSKDSRELLIPLVHKKIKIKYVDSEKTEGLYSNDRFKYVKHLWFEGPCDTDEEEKRINRKEVATKYQLVINSCIPRKMENLTITNNKLFGSDMIPMIANFVNLKKLMLSETNEVTRYHFICLSKLKFLALLQLQSCHIPDSDFRDFTALVELGIQRCTGVTDKIIDDIAHIHGLKILSLNWNSEFSNIYDLEKLKGLQKLNNLSMVCSEFVEHQHVTISFIHLQTLDVSHCNISPYLLNTICSTAGLTDLRINDTNITDDQLLLVLKKVIHLQALQVSAAITDTGLKYIGQKVSLIDLVIDGNPISDDGLQHLSTLILLEVIAIFDCDLTDTSLMHLSVLPLLRQLYIDEEYRTDGNKFSKKALDEWQKIKGWEYEFM